MKGAVVVLSHSQPSLGRTRSSETGEPGRTRPRTLLPRLVFLDEIETHLQLMMGLIRPQDKLMLAVQLQSHAAQHTRYLAIVTAPASNARGRECVLIGFDCVSAKGIS